jgi:hypothetical protein
VRAAKFYRAGHTVGRCRQVPLTDASRCED